MFDICVTERCQNILAEYISKGDTVIDCTAGNGSDTLFLAKCVGNAGCVLAFDVQEKALEATEKLLSESGFSCKRITDSDSVTVYLIHDSHENIADYSNLCENNAPSAIMYNLGYLPGGDHSIVTRCDSTLDSIKAAFDMIRQNGVISIVTYPGHAEGAKEDQLIRQLLTDLSPGRFEVLTIDQTNRSKAPVLYLVFKK